MLRLSVRILVCLLVLSCLLWAATVSDPGAAGHRGMEAVAGVLAELETPDLGSLLLLSVALVSFQLVSWVHQGRLRRARRRGPFVPSLRRVRGRTRL